MKRSTDRIITTHTGSLPRTPKVIELLLAERQNRGARKAELNAAVGDAIAHVVQKQIESGIDVINDGEQGRTDYTVHVVDRLAGFDGESTPPLGTGDPEFPELAQLLTQFASPFQYRPSCTGEVTWKDWGAAQADIDLSKEVMRGANATEWFMTAPSPGQIARYLKNKYYETEEAYVYALADTMKREYETIVDAGFILQLDCPDLAGCRHTDYQDMSESEFLKDAEKSIEALNAATAGIPSEAMRLHICWLNYAGPHTHDLPVAKLFPLLAKARPQAILFEGANPRHEHEWEDWKSAKLPDDKVLVPGVIDSTSNFVEHPRLIAQRIRRYADIVGRERVMAGADCGFGTYAGRKAVFPSVVLAKFRALAEGAAIASAELWRQ